jgi:two-component system, NarL family, nitrate/nitrite response regulator NarL
LAWLDGRLGVGDLVTMIDVAHRDVVRVVIVDDHEMFSRGLQLLFNAMPGGEFEVVATTADAATAGRLVGDVDADVALVDLQMPPPGGLRAVEAIKAARPATVVLVLTGVEDPASGMAALRAGADGYVVKTSSPEELCAPIRAASSGLRVMPGWLADSMLRAAAAQGPDLSFLGDDERQLLTLLASGDETPIIAGRLFVSERTAKRQIAALLRRLGVENRAQAAVLAGRSGLVDVAGPSPLA